MTRILTGLMTAVLVLTTVGIILAMIAAANASTTTGRLIGLVYLVSNMVGFCIAAPELRRERSAQNDASDQD